MQMDFGNDQGVLIRACALIRTNTVISKLCEKNIIIFFQGIESVKTELHAILIYNKAVEVVQFSRFLNNFEYFLTIVFFETDNNRSKSLLLTR